MSAPIFRFTGGTSIDTSLQSEFKILSNLGGNQLEELFTLILKFLVSPQSSEFEESLAKFAETHSITMRPLKKAVRSLLLLARGSMQNNLSAQQIKEDMEQLGFNNEQIEVVANVWETNLSKLSSSLVSKTIMANQLVDMEWKFGVTASSDEQEKIGSTFLQIKFTTDKGNGELQDTFLELSLSEFYQFLGHMENAKTHLDLLSSSSVPP